MTTNESSTISRKVTDQLAGLSKGLAVASGAFCLAIIGTFGAVFPESHAVASILLDTFKISGLAFLLAVLSYFVLQPLDKARTSSEKIRRSGYPLSGTFLLIFSAFALLIAGAHFSLTIQAEINKLSSINSVG